MQTPRVRLLIIRAITILVYFINKIHGIAANIKKKKLIVLLEKQAQ